MNIRPILSSLLRHKTAATLIVLEIALSCAIICNAVFLIVGRVEHMQRSSGVVEDELVYLSVSSIDHDGDGHAARIEDLTALAAVPGVKSASSINQVPYGDMSWSLGVSRPSDPPVSVEGATGYLDDGNLFPTLGLRVVEGRGFEPGEYQDMTAIYAEVTPSVVLTRALADELFPGQSAVGNTVSAWGPEPSRVVGVIDELIAPGTGRTARQAHQAFIVPIRPAMGQYVLRTDPDRREDVLQAAAVALSSVNPNRLIHKQETIEQMRRNFHSRDRAVVWLLMAVCVSLLAVTAFGIVGLASFWVQQRTRQIGIRRALGATRRQILRYFQAENFLLSTAGIVAGMLLAYGVNQWLMSQYELARLPLYYLPVGGAALWLLGQAAVLGPARRAAAVPPAVATRSA
ncbi:ABC transporter permease [Lysobacter sp. GX 14042]|uniref:ABC transporter permease n=1 Tax=Lysobacter sp. GX 14042 TaxID=2907155 RepID=UPI001F1F8FC5|nr:FtsX-like permease family protein [Lysobacter sp. GX 14042]MCE7033079.1 ABC transporter permease [Lysobacter sp. GX 14042]